MIDLFKSSHDNDNVSAQMLRYEQKFATNSFSFDQLQLSLFLSNFLLRVQHPDRWINNIYFDSEDMAAYRENKEGVSDRCKFRIRWYGELENCRAKPTLEFKRKCGSVGDKIKSDLGFWNNKNQLCRGEVLNLIRTRVDELGIIAEVSDKLPVLINRYCRSYFSSPHEDLRVTIDRHIAYGGFSSIGGSLISLNLVPELVLEVKYSKASLDEAQRLFENLSIRKTKYSKYCMGIDSLQKRMVFKV